jgi:predicted ATPase/transcriptional regulator with XRE-family HTH domain
MNDGDSQLSFGRWLRRRRKALDLTQVEFAARVPCARGTIRRIEADDLRPSKALAERLAAVLGIAHTRHEEFIRYARSGLANDGFEQPHISTEFGTPKAPAAAAPHSPSPVRRHMLSEDLAALIGRQYALAVAIEILARPDVRLVTLIGPPGVGKTRLARAVGAQIQRRYREGACFVELAPLRSPEHVLSAIAQAIELADSGAPLPATLAERLRGEELLLILDNFEHVLDAAPAISALLAVAPALNILCTSRVPLRISGEHEFVVPPLALPDLAQHAPQAGLESNPAVALFLTRARAVQPAFDIGEASLHQVAMICQRLDGLPLAIELAANRVKLFTPAALLGRLDRRLPLLTGGTRDAPARQRTLEAAISWSYDLLDTTERRCLARLGVFWGGATLGAIEAVCGDDLDVLAALTTLVDHSLLQSSQRESGDMRFTMLETIREFALARLDEQRDIAAVQARHARYYLGLAVEAERGLQGAEQVRWMARLNADDNNLRAAFAWSLSAEGDTAGGLRAGAGLWWFWWTNGQVGEGRRRLDDLLRRASAQGLSGTSDYGRALLGAGILAFFGGDFAAALPQFAQARELGASLADTITHGYATFMIGTVMVLAEQRGDGYAVLEEGSQILRSAGEQALWHVGVTSLASTLLVLERGDLEAAQRHADAGMAIFRELGQLYGIGLAFNYQGDVARLRGDHAAAATHYLAALPLLRQAHARSEIPAVLHNLAHVVKAQGDTLRAHALFAEGFELHREIGNRMGMAECLNGLAATLVVLRQPEPAAILLGAIETLLESLRVSFFAAEQTTYEDTTAAVRALLDAHLWEQKRLIGRAMTSAEIVGFAGAVPAAKEAAS